MLEFILAAAVAAAIPTPEESTAPRTEPMSVAERLLVSSQPMSGGRVAGVAKDAHGRTLARAWWNPATGDVQIAFSGDRIKQGKFHPYVGAEAEGFDHLQQLQIWMRLAYDHRINTGRFEFAAEPDAKSAGGGFTIAATNSYAPKGAFDKLILVRLSDRVDVRVQGWVCDRDNYSRGVPVHVYGKSIIGIGNTPIQLLDGSYSTSRTQGTREDVRAQCGNVAAHGFNFVANKGCRSNFVGERNGNYVGYNEVTVFGININSSGNVQGNNPLLGTKRFTTEAYYTDTSARYDLCGATPL